MKRRQKTDNDLNSIIVKVISPTPTHTDLQESALKIIMNFKSCVETADRN